MKLTPNQLSLLQYCCHYAIYDDYHRKRYTLLGGHGYASVRYHPANLVKLSHLGLVDSSNCYRATPKGLAEAAIQIKTPSPA